jgi:hypothetical protein
MDQSDPQGGVVWSRYVDEQLTFLRSWELFWPRSTKGIRALIRHYYMIAGQAGVFDWTPPDSTTAVKVRFSAPPVFQGSGPIYSVKITLQEVKA